jgi:hypothetical protein
MVALREKTAASRAGLGTKSRAVAVLNLNIDCVIAERQRNCGVALFPGKW